MNHWSRIDFRDSQQDAFAQLFPGTDSDVTQKGASHLAKEGLHNIKPRSMFGCQHVLEPVGAGCQKGLGFLGDVRRMVVQNDPYGAVGRIVLVQILKQSDKFAAAMSPLNARSNVALVQVQRRQNRTCSEALVFMIAADVGMFAGTGGKSGSLFAIAFPPRFSST